MTVSVLHIITTIDRGGAEHALLQLCQTQVSEGLQVSVFPLKGELELHQEFLRSGTHVVANGANRNILFQTISLKRQIKQYSIVHSHLPRAELISRLSVGKKPFVVTRHNAETFIKNRLPKISRFLSRWVLKRCDYLISISSAVEVFLKNIGEIPRTTISRVIYYGYSPKIENRDEHKKSAAEMGRELRLLAVNRLEKQKNVFCLLLATQILIKEGQSVRLTIAGEGSLRRELEIKTRQLGLENNVEFVGKISNVVNFMATQHIFVLTSNYEGFGLVLLEAIDAGLPIVASNNSAIPEVIGIHHPGLFETNNPIALAEKVLNLVNTPGMLSKCLDYQISQLEKFSPSTQAANYWSVYQECLIKRKIVQI